MKTIAILIIKFYKAAISPFLPPSCRFYPTCSQYAMEALEKYGFLKGSKMAVKRVLRCHPGNPGGFDPVE
ncbi:MAG: membrane protein insertion efficiency factor YidD [Chloroflexota bacterium]